MAKARPAPEFLTWRNETRKLSELVPWDRNPRQIKDAEARRLGESLLQFGQVQAIAIGPDNQIYDGHQRALVWSLLQEGGDREVDVRVSSRALSEKEREKLVVYLHRGATGSWNFEALANGFDFDELVAWGFSESELVGFDFGHDEPVGDDPGADLDKAAELQAKWQVQSGQLWVMGDHRLICGDCTDPAVVARVMGGEKARLVFTSPPYADHREYTIGKFDWLALAKGMFDALPLGDPCDVVINLGLSYKDGKVNQYWQPWLEHCAAGGMPLYGWYVWDKLSGFPGEWNGRLAPAHEWLFHFSVGRISARKIVATKGRTDLNSTVREKDGTLKDFTSPDKIGQLLKIPDSVIRMPPERSRSIHTQSHPATFPVKLPEFILQTWSDDNAIVYEPFSGSGTTLIACERLNRRCRAIEIEPKYCAVALERWAILTGQTPVLEKT